MEFKHTTLDNGLTVIAERNPAAASLACGFFVRTGSRDETPEVAGVSHFLEHMVFKGTERRIAADVNRAFDDMGAQYNAFTSEENTVYYAAALPEFQDRLLDVLGDILRPALRPEDFDVEKGVILDEIALYEDQPKFRVYDKLMVEHFRGHGLGNEILGTADSIRALRRDDMLAYFQRRYSPRNVTVVGVGQLDYDRYVQQVQALCGGWPTFEVQRQTPRAAPDGHERLLHDPKLQRQHVGLMSPAPSAQDDQRYAAMLAARVLGDDTGSRLFYALVDPAIADEASTAYNPFDGEGAFMTFLSADPDRAGEAVGIARAEMKTFQQEGPRAAELTAAKNKIAADATIRGELPMGRLTSVGADWVYRHEYQPLDEQIAELLAVSAEQVHEVIRSYDLTATTMLALGPREKL